MTTHRLALLAVALMFGPVLGGCTGSGTPAFVEAASQSLASNSSSNRAIKAEPSIFAGPDTSMLHRQDLGDKYAQQILKKSKRSSNTKLEAKLQDIVSHLSGHIRGDQFAYRLYLLEDLRPNAFTTGGGHLFVTTGLVSVLRSEGQIAAVMAHEMAHSAAAHVVKGAHGQSIIEKTIEFSDEVLDKRYGLPPWLGDGLSFLVTTGVNRYTRQQEDEADAMGLRLIVAAGYDPHEAPRAVQAIATTYMDQSEFENFFYGRHSTAKYRIWQFSNLIKAHYSLIDPADRIRTTGEYDELARPYWGAELAAIN